MTLDWSILRTIAAMRDEVGVLSVYVGRDPHTRAEGTATPSWGLRLRQQLSQVEETLREQGPRDHWRMLSRRLEELRPDLEPLLDPATSGQGRALFAGVAGGELQTVSLQLPLRTHVVLEPQAYLWPLVTAWSAAAPAGVVSISAEQLTIVDLRLGNAEPVGAIPYLTEVPEQDELLGPAAANPALAQHSASQRDLFVRREDVKLLRFLGGVGPQLTEHATRRGWDHLVLTGDAQLVQAVRDGLPQRFPARVLTMHHPVNALSAPKLATLVEPELEQARQQRHRELAQEVRERADSGAAGATGVAETVGALQEGRVSHLLLAADGQWSGSRTPEGILTAEGELPPGIEPETLVEEPYLGERMIELALGQGADITTLAGAEAEPLAEADGVGAVLRW